jgi:catechol 2,3-dioxygenase-like lactoylglutathione lyase family enzyme
MTATDHEEDDMGDGVIGINEVRTVAVSVTDQDRALEFYVGTLGFEKRMDGSFGDGMRWIEVAPPGATTSIALVAADDERPSGVDTGIRLATADAAADYVSLRARGVETGDELIPFPVPMFTFRDQDGNRLFVVEVPS